MRDGIYDQTSACNMLWTEVVRAAETLILELCDWGLQAFQLLSLSIACKFLWTSTETALHFLIAEKVYEH